MRGRLGCALGLTALGAMGFVSANAMEVPPIDTTDRAAVVAAFDTYYQPTLNPPLRSGWTGSVQGCVAGTIDQAFKDATRQMVNYHRAMVGLPGNVTFDPANDAKNQAAALIQQANPNLWTDENLNPHAPPPTSECYTEAGREGSASSNLSWNPSGLVGPDSISQYMDDNGTANLGHRRWIIYPPRDVMGLGAAEAYSALWSFGPDGARPATPTWIAWPPPGYVPYQLVDGPDFAGRWPAWSFSAVATLNGATVAVTRDGQAVPVTLQPGVVNAPGFGDPAIGWKWNTLPTDWGPGMADTTYRVTVSGIAGFASTSVTYDVIIFDPASGGTTPPANDGFANAVALTELTGTANGSNANATGETGEPNHAGTSAPLASVWWRWTPSATGQATIGTCGSGYDTTLAVYTGTAVGALTEVASNDDGCNQQSQVQFDATAGTTYHIAVDGVGTATGDISLTYALQPIQQGTPSIAVGLHGTAGAGRVESLDQTGANVAFMEVPWPAYNAANGETRPAWCDVDGDGAHELAIGLGSYPANGGWLQVRDDAAANHAHLQWLRIPWGTYDAANGETWPACGDVDGDGRDEIVVGLGRGGGGMVYVFDDANATPAYGPHPATPEGSGWLLLGWSAYDTAIGEIHPAVGNLDADADKEEIVLGLGRGGQGYARLLDDSSAGFAPLSGTPVNGGWLQVGWGAYNTSNGETWPAVCDLNGDTRGEVVLSLSSGGWSQIRDSANTTTPFGPPTPDTVGGNGWVPLGWAAYNAAVGIIHPACGDLGDGDVADELLLGLGTYTANGGWTEARDDLNASLAHLGWWRLHLPEYNAADGLTRPAMAR